MNAKTPARPVSAMLTSLPLSFEDALRQSMVLGFTHVDVVALPRRPPAHLEALAESGLLVSCAAIGRDLPEGRTLDAARLEARRAAVSLVQRHIADAASLGATTCYVVPCHDASDAALARFADSCCRLADYAATRMVRLCVEHVPGRALATVQQTLAWLTEADHANLQLLLDVGHCLITREPPANAVEAADQRLGYVHFDDNDGTGDLHWPLLTGRLTTEQLSDTVRALQHLGYTGAFALELNPQNEDPVRALQDGKALLEELQGSDEGPSR